MSYSIDRSRAVALEQRDGVWSLEVESLVRVTRNTFRPRRQRVTGADAIMQHLFLHDGPLVAATREVLEQAAGQLESRFEVHGSGWVPAPLLEDVQLQAPTPPPEAMHRPQLDTGVIQEIVTLGERLDRLEKSLSMLADEFAQGITADGLETGAGAEDEDPELAGLADSLMGGDDATAEPEPEPEPDFKALKMPQLDAVEDLIKGLAGDEIAVTLAESEGWAFDQVEKGYLAPLKDDKGEVVGILAMDLEATIRLAGGMLMEPKEELDSQVEDESPSEDIIDAAGEVLNTLTSSVNKVSGNTHVRSGGLEPLSVSSYPWLLRPRVRGDFRCSVGGRVVIIGR